MQDGEVKIMNKDTVYRDDVIEKIYQALRTPLPDYHKDPFHDSMSVAIAMANELPSAQPERKTGQWLAVEYDNNAQPHIMLAKPMHEEADDISDNPSVHCSVCGKNALFNGWSEKYVLSNFCPNCGADMRGGINGNQ